MLELRVFTSFQKRTDKAQHNKELKANSTFDGKDKSIPNIYGQTIVIRVIYTGISIFTRQKKIIMSTHYFWTTCVSV